MESSDHVGKLTQVSFNTSLHKGVLPEQRREGESADARGNAQYEVPNRQQVVKSDNR